MSKILAVGHENRIWPREIPLQLFMATLHSRCGHYIFLLWFLLSVFFSSPILSRRRLDAYRTSTHDVALVQIYNAGLKCADSGSLKIQDAKISNLHHRTNLSGHIFATKANIDNGKKLVKQQYLLHMCSQYGELQSLAAKILW